MTFDYDVVEPYLDRLVHSYPNLAGMKESVRKAAGLLVSAFAGGGKLLICGNGGSAADADHIVGELMKSFVLPRHLDQGRRASLVTQDEIGGAKLAERLQGALPAIALTQHTALATAFSNDVDPELVFAQQVLGYGRKGDVFWGLSTSGNSRNVLYAAMTARAAGIPVIGMTGKDGGALASRCDVLIAVPELETYKVQELHLPIYHTLSLIVERVFFG